MFTPQFLAILWVPVSSLSFLCVTWYSLRNETMVCAHQILPTLFILMLFHNQGEISIRRHFREMIQMANLQSCHAIMCMQAWPCWEAASSFLCYSSLEESTLPMRCSPNGKDHHAFSSVPTLTWSHGAQEPSLLHSHSKCPCFVPYFHNKEITCEPRKGLSMVTMLLPIWSYIWILKCIQEFWQYQSLADGVGVVVECPLAFQKPTTWMNAKPIL